MGIRQKGLTNSRVFAVGLFFAASAAVAQVVSYDYLTNGVQSASVQMRNGTPQLLINGQAVPPLLFFFNSEGPNGLGYLQPQAQVAADAGIHLLTMGFRPWPWEGGTPNYSWTDHILDEYLAVNPRAVFLLRVDVSPGIGWVPATPPNDDQNILYADGSRGPVSVASQLHHKAFLNSFRAMIRHYEASQYGRHILGYQIGGQETGEWFPEGYREKGLDYSPVNRDAFRVWLGGKYATDAALSAAWGRSVTLGSAAIPRPAPGRFPIRSNTSKLLQSFYDLPQEQDWIDYSQYISDLISSRILDAARVMKEETNRKKLASFFHGYIYAAPGSMNGHLRLDRLLQSGDLDLIASPLSYLPGDRIGGGSGGFASAADSVALHGKVWMNESDLRTWLQAASPLPECCYNGEATHTFEETFGVLQRDMASFIVHRSGTWWMDLNAKGAFNDTRLWTIMRDGRRLFDELYTNPAPYRPEVALITSAASVAYEKSDWDLFSLGRPELRSALAKTGAQVGFYTLEDFIDGSLPRCKVYVFANVWNVTDAQTAAIRQRLETERAIAVWQYGAGYIGPTGMSVQRMEALTGIHVVMDDNIAGSRGEGPLDGIIWGYAGPGGQVTLSPRFVVEDSASTTLGRYLSDGKVSTVQKAVGGWTSVLVADFSWRLDLSRRLLKILGVHLWSEAGDTVHTDGHLLSIHSGKPGPRSIQLPRGYEVRSLQGELLARWPATLGITFASTGETKWFLLASAPRRHAVGRP